MRGIFDALGNDDAVDQHIAQELARRAVDHAIIAQEFLQVSPHILNRGGGG
jgi:hypothetical protein